MAIQFPSDRKQVDARMKADVRANLPTSNPWLKNSFLGAIVTSLSGRTYETYLQIKNALLEMFPDTASLEYLERWGSYVNISRLDATGASGSVVFTGTVGTLIPLGSTVVSSDGLYYSVTAPVEIATVTKGISSIVRTVDTATATSSLDHGFATGMTVTISGAGESAYNGDFVITVLDSTSFSYTVSGSPSTPATGTITASADMASVEVSSAVFGAATNQASGAVLALNSVIVGADSDSFVPYAGLGGGADQESDDLLRERILYRYRNPIAQFNESQIVLKARENASVTRVWVHKAGTPSSSVSVTSITRSGSIATVTTSSDHLMETGQIVTISGASPSGYNGTHKVLSLSDTTFAYKVDSALSTPATGTIMAEPGIPNGQVKIYFVQDNEANIIPASGTVDLVKDEILTLVPAHVSESDVIVAAPTAVTVDFDFSSLSPNTETMQAAIEEALANLFKVDTEVSQDLEEAAYMAAIWQAVSDRGERVQSFTLSAPTGSVTASIGYLPVLGTVTWP